MTHEERLTQLERRMDASDHERHSMLEVINRTSELVETVARDTEEMREIWSEARGAFKLFTRLMAAIQWTIKFLVLPVVAILVALFALGREGHPPAWLEAIRRAFS